MEVAAAVPEVVDGDEDGGDDRNGAEDERGVTSGGTWLG